MDTQFGVFGVVIWDLGLPCTAQGSESLRLGYHTLASYIQDVQSFVFETAEDMTLPQLVAVLYKRIVKIRKPILGNKCEFLAPHPDLVFLGYW